jgi:hypothetical protein
MPKSMFKLYFILGMLLSPFLLVAQDYYFEDFVYSESIKSVKFTPYGSPADFPVAELGSSDRLHLSFDDLDAVDKRYTYKIIHCDRDWNRSKIDEMDYLEGFNGEEIRDSYHSISTKIDYVHYDLVLPNDYVQWIISGNYLLIVLDENDYPIITKRFLVAEPSVSIHAEFINPKKVSQLKTHQCLNLEINYDDFYIRDPLNEVTVTVLQNFKWIDAIQNRKAKNLMGNTLIF